MRVIDIPAHLLFLATEHPFLFFPIAIVAALILFRRSRHRLNLVGPALVVALLNLFFGPYLSSYLLYKIGEPGSAEVTDAHATSIRYNGHNVVGYDVLLRTVEGKVVESSFDDIDGNLYSPSRYDTSGMGDRFKVRYLPTFPQDFVIVTDDDSPWAHRLVCSPLEGKLAAAKSKFEFDNQGATYRDAYIAAIEVVIAGYCYHDNESILAYYREELDKAKAGKP